MLMPCFAMKLSRASCLKSDLRQSLRARRFTPGPAVAPGELARPLGPGTGQATLEPDMCLFRNSGRGARWALLGHVEAHTSPSQCRACPNDRP